MAIKGLRGFRCASVLQAAFGFAAAKFCGIGIALRARVGPFSDFLGGAQVNDVGHSHIRFG